jgi:hypothetical protein
VADLIDMDGASRWFNMLQDVIFDTLVKVDGEAEFIRDLPYGDAWRGRDIL